jgi:3',5'-cyclic AMP phosphodiesterase CpdA
MDLSRTSTLARLARPRSDDRTLLAVVADPHVGTEAEGAIKRFEHTEAALRAALADAEARGVDAVLSPGDLTKDGEPWNYEAVDDALAELSVPFYAVPGNHDVPKESDEHDPLAVETFADRYSTGEGYPFHVRVAGLDVVGLNSAGTADRRYDDHEGAVDDDQLAAAADLLADCADPIVLNHYNLPGVNDQVRSYTDALEPELGNVPLSRAADRLEATLVDADAPLVLTGHLHLPAAARAGPTTEVMTPATCSFPQAYLLVDVGPGGTEVRFVPAVDREELRAGYHDMITDSAVSRALAGLAATNLAQFPLYEDW